MLSAGDGVGAGVSSGPVVTGNGDGVPETTGIMIGAGVSTAGAGNRSQAAISITRMNRPARDAIHLSRVQVLLSVFIAYSPMSHISPLPLSSLYHNYGRFLPLTPPIIVTVSHRIGNFAPCFVRYDNHSLTHA